MRGRVVFRAGGRRIAGAWLMLAVVVVAVACNAGADGQQDDQGDEATVPADDGQGGQDEQDEQDDGLAAGRDEDSAADAPGDQAQGSADTDAAAPVDQERDVVRDGPGEPAGAGTPAPVSGSDDGASSAPKPVSQPARTEGWTMTDRRPPRGAGSACTEVTTRSPGAFFVFPNDGITAGDRPVTIEFLGCSDTFEANVVYEAYHGRDKAPTLTGFTMGGTLGDWAEFRFEAAFWTPGRWTVIVLEDDAESGKRRVYDRVTFTVDPS